MKETCLSIDALPTTLQSECIHVTFRSNEEKFVLLQLTRSVILKHYAFKRIIWPKMRTFHTMYDNF